MAKRKKKSKVNEVPEPVYPVKEDEDKWKIESDLEALLRAEEIRGDEERLKKVMKMAKEKRTKYTSIAQLKERRDELASEEAEAE